MIFPIKKWYDRLLAFVGLEILGVAIYSVPIIVLSIPLNNFIPEVFLLWFFFVIMGVIGIWSASGQCVQRMKIFRFMTTFIISLIASVLFWAVLLWLILFISKEDHWELYAIFFLTSPILTPWTLACLMLLTLWPFHAVRNTETS